MSSFERDESHSSQWHAFALRVEHAVDPHGVVIHGGGEQAHLAPCIANGCRCLHVATSIHADTSIPTLCSGFGPTLRIEACIHPKLTSGCTIAFLIFGDSLRLVQNQSALADGLQRIAVRKYSVRSWKCLLSVSFILCKLGGAGMLVIWPRFPSQYNLL